MQVPRCRLVHCYPGQDPVNTKRIHLITSLTPRECVARLTPVMEGRARPIRAYVLTESALEMRLGRSNAFRDSLKATIRPEAGGTVISGKVAMHPFSAVFLVAWLGFFIVIAMASILSRGWKWDGTIFLLGMPVFLLIVMFLVRFSCRDDARVLTEFLVRTLEAREVTEQLETTQHA
jgi:hypothetical protein